ncbi:MAG: aminotransferase class V-fold PLP-dependent enzyme [Nitrospirota bacterium]
MYKQIFLDAPNVGRHEKKYLNKAIDSGFVSTIGPFVSEFEDSFAQYLGVKKAVSTQSGTAALHMALHELGIGSEDEVIVPALTFVATVNPIMYVGAKPVFADVDIHTWNIDPAEIEKKITKKTKAILIVHLYGNPCDMDRVMKIARKYKLYVIEDATESLGATYKSKFTGTFGDFGCFSFNGNKIITTGGGGMVVGKNAKKLEHIKFLVNQARDESNGYYHPEIGFNYRMTNIEAAIGIGQLKKVDDFLKKKRLFHGIYQEELQGIASLAFQAEYPNAHSSFWLTCVSFRKGVDIQTLQKALKGKGVPSRRVFMPVVEFQPYRKFKKRICRNSHTIFDSSLCLPGSTLNTENDIHYTCNILKGLLRG